MIMKVICIDASPKKERKANYYLQFIKEGSPYTVQYEDDGAYKLVEVSYAGVGVGEPTFSASRFIPLSNIDEMAIIELEKQMV